ncbi:MAG: hypothetical protein ACREP8_02715, partial [Candidatus Binatia bacterium]
MENLRDLLGVKMKPEEAKAYIAKLREMMLENVQRKLLGGRFHRELGAGTLPVEAIKVFWQNWYSFVAEINNFLGCAYQRHLPFFKRHPELQAPFANQVADELIHPKPPGHIQIVLEQGRLFGLGDEEMIDYEMLPECRAFLEYYRGLLYEGTMAEWWAAFCLEEGVGHWARFFGQALRKSYRFQDKQIVYFT